MTYYYFESQQGCGIRLSESLEQAKEEVLSEVGFANFKLVREASDDDIAWVEGMGGHIPAVPDAPVCPNCKKKITSLISIDEVTRKVSVDFDKMKCMVGDYVKSTEKAVLCGECEEPIDYEALGLEWE